MPPMFRSSVDACATASSTPSRSASPATSFSHRWGETYSPLAIAAPPSARRRSRNASRDDRRLGNGERDEAPLPIPSSAGVILHVRQPMAFHVAAERFHPLLGREIARRPPAALPSEQALLHEAAQTRPHLVGGLSAGFSDGQHLVGDDGAVLVRHTEHEHPGRDANGRLRHDHNLPTCRGGRTPSCRGRPSVPLEDRRRW